MFLPQVVKSARVMKKPSPTSCRSWKREAAFGDLPRKRQGVAHDGERRCARHREEHRRRRVGM
ncbi:MAG: hypothetical protein R3B08_04845 [Nitrospira sp.]